MFWETNFKKITIFSLLSAVFLGIVSVGMDSPAKAESANADNREVIGNPYSAESEEDEQDEQDEETGQEEEQPAGTEEDEQQEDGTADD
ncbi:MAG: hypothetical protein KME19_15100 [Microcoleus vaginatus WJT46-NPBG5]|jgi:Na+-translocating ferredoxin:NAD+ oxidoreductase RnfG subunit|nr:hypothetical protein [Microcoleus vaginatus WJT46-NPBG5]